MQSSSCRLVPEVRETRTAAGTQTAGVFSIPLIPPIAIGRGGGGIVVEQLDIVFFFAGSEDSMSSAAAVCHHFTHTHSFFSYPCGDI